MDVRDRIGKNLALVGALGIAASLVAACAPYEGVTQADFEAVSRQAAAKDQQLADKGTEMAALQQKLKDKEGIKVLTSAKKGVPPTPAPPPTPLPAGAAPPPPRLAPASYREATPFAFYIETILSAGVYSGGWSSTVPCTPSSVFGRGQGVVWRFEVFDISTGRRLIDVDEANVTIKIPFQPDMTARFSQRAGGRVPDAPWMWGARWDIPLDYPLGSVDYTISVTTKDGRSYTWKQPALINPDPAANTDSRLKVIDGL